jgi:tRNA-splicing ligase RtcB
MERDMTWKDLAILHDDGYYTLATEETRDVPVRLFLTAQLLEETEGDIYKQIVNATKFPGVKLVCITPDVHVGYGVPIGCVLVTDGTLCLGPVGYDIGCFTGDTLIPLADGNSYTMRELADRSEPFWCISIDDNQKIAVEQATAKKTRTQAALLKVTLDNEREIICTPDHQFMLRNGTYCEAQELHTGSSLMPFYSQRDEQDYVIVKHPKTGSWQSLHWVIGRQGLLGKIPSFLGQKTVIHHRNFTPSDNRPENLEFMGDKDHMQFHHKNGRHNIASHRHKLEPARVAALAAKAKTEEGHTYFAERGTANIRKYMQEQPEHFKQAVAGNGQRGRKTLLAYNTSDKGRQKSSEVAHKEHICETCGAVAVGGLGIHNHRRWNHGYNHKVVSVEPLDYTEDVYCLNVPDYGNFALDAGVFVHNCGMMSARSNVPWDKATPKKRLEFNRAVMARVEMGMGGTSKRLPHLTVSEFEKLIRGGAEYYCEHYGSNVDRSHVERNRLPVDDSWQPPYGSKGKPERGIHQLGSLGGGNHFMELQRCIETDTLFLQVHTGSRGFGHGLATNYFDLAKREHPEQGHIDMGYFTPDSPNWRNYLNAVNAGGNFAILNRLVIFEQVAEAFKAVFGSDLTMIYEISHNLAQYEWTGEEFGRAWVHRKGATRAFPAGHPGLAGSQWEHRGHPVLIPGSNHDYSFILTPASGAEKSAFSVNHGAGRRMSRGQARKQLSQKAINAEYAKAGILVNDHGDVPLDEAGPCYKSSEQVINAVVQAGLATVQYRLWPLASLKGLN